MNSIPEPASYLEKPYGQFAGLINAHSENQPNRVALQEGDDKLSWSQTTDLANRIAVQLRAEGLQAGQAVSVLGLNSVHYACAYLGAILAGGCAAPLTTSASPKQLASMMTDSGASHLFIDSAKRAELAESGVELPPLKHVMLDKADADAPYVKDWMAAAGSLPDTPEAKPEDPFNIIYSSGTTGTPKGIVHSHLMRWRQIGVGEATRYGKPGQATLLSTPMYSNTTLAPFLATVGYGGTAILMRKFDCETWLTLAQKHKVTHTMLVPVQYQRLMDYEQFDDYDLSSLFVKNCTSAPFSAELKAEVLKRMPGGLVEAYGMTEGGVVCVLIAHAHPDKLHTVGVPHGGSEVITIDEDLKRLPIGEMGELVGRSGTMMSGYQNQPEKTKEATWIDENGDRWQRMGDIGRVDEEGFVTIMGRSKDMIISGGFNIYPRDLEEVLLKQSGVVDAAVIGIDSRQWGETPLGFVVAEKGVELDLQAIMEGANSELGKTQRLSEVRLIDELPRSHIGKILKTELRDMVG
ncbi:MAG: class I adenylate-forming enzyme family protein [Pseudomonadales bacterium]